MLLFKTTRPRDNIWYVVSPSRLLLIWFKLWHWGQKCGRSVVTCFNNSINVYRENIKKIFLSDDKRLNGLYFVCSIT